MAKSPVSYQTHPLPHPLPARPDQHGWPWEEGDSAFPHYWRLALLAPEAPEEPSADLFGEVRGLLASGRWGSALRRCRTLPPETRLALWQSVPSLAWALVKVSHPFLTPNEALKWLNAIGPLWLKLPYLLEQDDPAEAGSLSYHCGRRRVLALGWGSGLDGPLELVAERYRVGAEEPEGTVKVWVLREDADRGWFWEEKIVLRPDPPCS